MSTQRSKVPLALALLVGAASAMSTSLGNLMMVSASNQIPANCLRVYNSPIPGCQTGDFQNECSQECLRGLGQLQQDIQRACQGVRAGGSTLLGRALQGTLVEALCDNAGHSNQQPNPPSPPPVVVPVPTRGGDGSSTASQPTQRPLKPNPQPAPPTSAAQPPPIQTQTTLAPRPTNSNDDDDDDNGGPPNGVGGSPFDIVAGTGSSTRSPMMFAAVIAIIATIALLPVR